MLDPALNLAAVLFPLIALRDSGLSHYHLHKRLEPDPTARFFRAFFRYLASVFLALSVWGICQTFAAVLFSITSPFIPMVLATLFTMAFNHYVLRTPADWREQQPYLAEDRSYHTFLRLVADRAAEIKGRPDRRDAYLERMYADEGARLQAVGQYLTEHRDQDWLTLKPSQLAYHPAHFRFPMTTLYMLALLPIIIPFMLRLVDPAITEENLSLTVIASALGAIFYSPLFDPGALIWITSIAVATILCLAVFSEFERLKAFLPGLVGLLVFAMFGVFMWHYLQTYVAESSDTGLMRVTNFVLDRIETAATAVSKGQNVEGALRFLGMHEAVELLGNADKWVTYVRERVLAFQSRVGVLFMLPAFLFWGGLTLGVMWELHFTQAAQVTFFNRMRKPAI